MDKVKKKKVASVDFSCALFSRWDFLILVDGPTGCSVTSVRNCHSMPHSIPEEHRSHLTIWRCRPWSDSKCSGSEWSSLAYHARISDDLTYLSTKLKENPHLWFK